MPTASFPEHVKHEWVSDPWILDERFLIVNVKYKGLIVFSACFHADIVNVLKETKFISYQTLVYCKGLFSFACLLCRKAYS